MIAERFKNNRNLLDSFNNTIMYGERDAVEKRPFCYIACSVTNYDKILLMPIIGRNQGMGPNEMSKPGNYSILTASSKKELKKLCKNRITLTQSYYNIATIGISRETYDRIKRESDKLISEVLKEIGNEYKGVGFKSAAELINTVDDSFLQLKEIYPKDFYQTREMDYDNYNNYDNYDNYTNDDSSYEHNSAFDDYDEIGDDNGDGLIDGLDYPGPEW